jgi:hypothetical protein
VIFVRLCFCLAALCLLALSILVLAASLSDRWFVVFATFPWWGFGLYLSGWIFYTIWRSDA